MVDTINKKITMKEIANLSGVSTATVSKILSKKDQFISETTRNKVLQIVNENNYVANKIASSMVTKKTYSIGLIIPDITNEFFTKLSRGVEDFANEKGYNVILCNTDNNGDKAFDYLKMLEEKMVDGILLASDYNSSNGSRNVNVPIVAIDRDVFGLGIEKSVGINNINGGYEATEYLISRGCKKILHLTGDLKYTPTNDRIKGYKSALENNNISFDENLVITGDFTIECGYTGVKKVIDNKINFDSVFCGNDLIAVGVIKALQEENIKIPEDISVVGFDDVFLASLITPPLTTIQQPMYKIGYEGAKALINILEDNEFKNEKVELNTKLIIRNSTK